jgi:hypothetical protein
LNFANAGAGVVNTLILGTAGGSRPRNRIGPLRQAVGPRGQAKKRGVAPQWARGVLCALDLSNDDRAARRRNAVQNLETVTVSFLSFSVSARIANLIFLVYISGAVTGGSLFALFRHATEAGAGRRYSITSSARASSVGEVIG